MKPHRVRMAHSLILHAGLYSQMDAFRPRPADAADLAAFHAEDYVQFLATVTPVRVLECLLVDLVLLFIYSLALLLPAVERAQLTLPPLN
jgi:hypothetical protein